MALNLHLLRMFTTVARVGSFSRAAELLKLSQPAISKGVRDFELQVGCRLLNRSQKGVLPTSEGLALLKHAEDLFAAERAAEEVLSARRDLNNGSLRIGASTTIATYMLAPYLGAFHRAYPGVDLHLVSANTREIADQMAAQDIDVGLVEGPIEEGIVVAEKWRTDTMKLIVSPDHEFASAKDPIDPSLLGGQVLILREPGSGSREVVTQVLAANNIEPLRLLEIGSTAAIKQVVAAGIGVSIVSMVAASDQVRLGYLRTVELRGVKIERTLWRLKLPDRTSRPAARVFEELLDDQETPQSEE
jgi:DNA-binding transcriptional LysR family regulator